MPPKKSLEGIFWLNTLRKGFSKQCKTSFFFFFFFSTKVLMVSLICTVQLLISCVLYTFSDIFPFFFIFWKNYFSPSWFCSVVRALTCELKGLIPNKGTCLVCRLSPWLWLGEATNPICFFHINVFSIFSPPPTPHFHSLKTNERISLGEY